MQILKDLLSPLVDLGHTAYFYILVNILKLTNIITKYYLLALLFKLIISYTWLVLQFFKSIVMLIENISFISVKHTAYNYLDYDILALVLPAFTTLHTSSLVIQFYLVLEIITNYSDYLYLPLLFAGHDYTANFFIEYLFLSSEAPEVEGPSEPVGEDGASAPAVGDSDDKEPSAAYATAGEGGASAGEGSSSNSSPNESNTNGDNSDNHSDGYPSDFSDTESDGYTGDHSGNEGDALPWWISLGK